VGGGCIFFAVVAVIFVGQPPKGNTTAKIKKVNRIEITMVK